MESNTKSGAARPPRPRHERRTSGDRSPPLAALQCTAMTRSAKYRRQAKLPKLGRHSSGQARVTLNGKVHYLGPFGSPEAHQRYAELVQHWLDAGRQPLQQPPHAGQAVLTVRDAFARYREWILATGRYVKNGQPTSQRRLIDEVLDAFEVADEQHPEVDARRDRGASTLAVERLAQALDVGSNLASASSLFSAA